MTVTVGDLPDGFYVAADRTGLGLQVVDEIATAHDRTVRAADAESGGAGFVLTGIAIE